jgi:hypothetical protein
MGKRVYEIAREQSLGTEEVMKRLNDAGIEVKSHFAIVESSVYERVFGDGHNGRATTAAATVGGAGSRRPYRVRVPGFLKDDEEVGLGDVIKKVTATARVAPCGGCERRAAALNRWIAFSGRRPR